MGCAYCVIYTKNRSPHSALGGITPYERFYGRKPNTATLPLHVFGCTAILKLSPPQVANKLAPRGKKAIFIGYGVDQASYVFYDVENANVVRTRNAEFLEYDFSLMKELSKAYPRSKLILITHWTKHLVEARIRMKSMRLQFCQIPCIHKCRSQLHKQPFRK